MLQTHTSGGAGSSTSEPNAAAVATTDACSPLAAIDYRAFAADVSALHAELKSDLGTADLRHLRRMEAWGRACTLIGYAFAWIIPNPLSALLMGLGNVSRWANVTHPILHRGYDNVPDVPPRHTSGRFAQGWRRFLDWPDWLHPAAWAHEHNQLHHFHTGQEGDPDLVERNAAILRRAGLPRPLRQVMVLLLMMTWKLSYYAPNTLWALKQHRAMRAGGVEAAAAAKRT